MCFIKTPNLPSEKVGLAVVDGRIKPAAEKKLLELGVRLVKTEMHTGVYQAVCGHPDIMLCHAGGEKIVHAPGCSFKMLEMLSSNGFELVEGGTELKPAYPYDIAYNVAIVGKYFFHNLKYTDGVLLKELEKAGAEAVNVSQGYAKCSTAIIDEHSIITADSGIARAAEKKGFDVLEIPPQRNISLPGLDYGFIGGCSGMLGKGCWAVFGKAEKLDSFDEIKSFLDKKNCRIISLSDDDIIDFGSLLPIKT